MNIDKLAYRKAVNHMMKKATEMQTRAEIASENEPIWTEPIPFAEKKEGLQKTINYKKTMAIGVYCMIYKPTMTVMGIGQGNIATRIRSHLQSFRNKGKVRIGENSITHSPLGRNMYEYDKNEDNWLVEWCILNDKELSCSYEETLQNLYEPQLNSILMAGKG